MTRKEAMNIVRDVADKKLDLNDLPDETVDEFFNALFRLVRWEVFKHRLSKAFLTLVFVTCVIMIIVSLNDLINIFANL
jgi:hypothetical protein